MALAWHHETHGYDVCNDSLKEAPCAWYKEALSCPHPWHCERRWSTKLKKVVALGSQTQMAYHSCPHALGAAIPIDPQVSLTAAYLLCAQGMFTEAYFVFSVGNLTALFQLEYPDCWVAHTQCSSALLQSIHYTQVGDLGLSKLIDEWIASAMSWAAGRVAHKQCSSAVLQLAFLKGSCF